MRTSALFGTKNMETLGNYGVSARTRGVEPVGTFCERRGESPLFTILYGRHLWTAP